jgi:hypothetical protein
MQKDDVNALTLMLTDGGMSRKKVDRLMEYLDAADDSVPSVDHIALALKLERKSTLKKTQKRYEELAAMLDMYKEAYTNIKGNAVGDAQLIPEERGGR